MRPLPPRRPTIKRERLLAILAGRFDRRVTVVRAGAGFGKTTLLGHAIAENDLDPRGIDVWIDLTAAESSQGLPAVIVGVLGNERPPDAASIGDVVDLVWQRAPERIALLLDNVHRVGDPVATGELLLDLVDKLPANGHLVLSSRTRPLPYARLLASGEGAILDESDLAFTADELDRFAGLRHVETSELGNTGWPALLELRATVGAVGERQYISEEILAGLDSARVTAIRRVAPLGWLDDHVVHTVTDYPGTADELVRGLPLTSRADDGRIVLHDLWQAWLPALPPVELRDVNRQLADVMLEREELAAAFRLYVEADQPKPALEIVRTIARDYGLRHPLSVRREIMKTMPPELAGDAAVRMVEADVAFITHPQNSTPVLEAARDSAREADDPEIEAHAILRLSEMLYQSHRGNELAEMVHELDQLDADRSEAVGAIRGLVMIWHAMTTNQMALAASIASSSVVTSYEPSAAHARYFAGIVASHTGHGREGLERLAITLPHLSGLHAARAGGLQSMLRFYVGDMDEEHRADVVRLTERILATGHTHLYVEGAATVALYHLAAGDMARARELHAAAERESAELGRDSWGVVTLTLLTAALAVIEGDEERATALIDHVMPEGGPFDGLNRHVFNNFYAVTYALSERSRAVFDDDVVGPDFELAREVGRALVTLRSNAETAPAARLPWNELERLRPWAYEPHLAELAIAALVEGNLEAELAIKELRHDPHGSLELVRSRHDGRMKRKVDELLARTPRQPTQRVRLRVLGPMQLRIGDAVVPATKMRRRVVELFQLLVDQRTLTRQQIVDRLWPDLDASRGRNNLRVTLAHLVKMLEPDRGTSPPWHVRSNDDVISLVPSEFLELDVDDFVESFRDARNHDRSGVPSLALDAYLRCCEIYVGDYLDDVFDPDIGYDERTGLRLDFVAAATRGAQLLTAAGRAAEAVRLAARAVESEPLAESGHAALLAALNDLDRRRDAVQASSKCRAIFAEADLSISPELERQLVS